MDVLARKAQTGALNLEGTLAELEAAGACAEETGSLVVINDITNFIRYGDFTAVSPDGNVSIVEVKAGKGSSQSGRAARQSRKLSNVTTFLNNRWGHTRYGASAILRHNVALRTHLPSVEQLIGRARETGAANERLSDCLAVDVWCMDRLFADGRKPTRHNPFEQSGQAMTGHSLKSFSSFAPNFAPYSVFPLTARDCADLIVGAIWLVSHFNWGNVVRCLKRRDLQVEVVNDGRLPFTPGTRQEFALAVSRGRYQHAFYIPWGELGRIMMEFLSEESFADAIEELLDRSTWRGAPVSVFASFASEPSLWN
ncbi:MAG: hypothetical protein WEE64_02190 [Dehalococcoidia bacterium]